jgi:neutral ceramidase
MLLLLGSFCGYVPASPPAAPGTDEFSAKAGWAEVNITPPLGLEMGGRGPTETVGDSVLDPLYAQVLCVQDDRGSLFVLVSFDLVGMTHDLSDRIRLKIAHETGADWNLVVLNVSHTHSGPQMGYTLMAGVPPIPANLSDYFDSLADKIVTATRAAMANLAPVKAEVFDGRSQVAINRRGKNKNGEPSMVPNPQGPIAERLWVMRLSPQDRQKAPAVVFSYGCHPVIVYGYAGSAISADYPGEARRVLRRELGAQAHLQFVQGLAGNVRPRTVADVKGNRFRPPTPQDLQNAGNELAQDVLRALKLPGKTLRLELAAQFDRPLLRRDKPPPRATYERLLASAKSTPQQRVARYWLERYDNGFGFAKADPWPMGLIRLTQNQWVLYLAGEPCVEWEPLVSKWLAPRDVVLWGYSQEMNTYLPTDELLPEGGYEVLDSNRARASSPAPFAPGINEGMRKSVLSQLKALQTSLP